MTAITYKPTHSPAPWRRSSLGYLYIISGDEPEPVCAMGEYGKNGEVELIFNNAEANTNLIIASPLLLETLKAAREILSRADLQERPALEAIWKGRAIKNYIDYSLSEAEKS